MHQNWMRNQEQARQNMASQRDMRAAVKEGIELARNAKPGDYVNYDWVVHLEEVRTSSYKITPEELKIWWAGYHADEDGRNIREVVAAFQTGDITMDLGLVSKFIEANGLQEFEQRFGVEPGEYSQWVMWKKEEDEFVDDYDTVTFWELETLFSWLQHAKISGFN